MKTSEKWNKFFIAYERRYSVINGIILAAFWIVFAVRIVFDENLVLSGILKTINWATCLAIIAGLLGYIAVTFINRHNKKLFWKGLKDEVQEAAKWYIGKNQTIEEYTAFQNEVKQRIAVYGSQFGLQPDITFYGTPDSSFFIWYFNLFDIKLIYSDSRTYSLQYLEKEVKITTDE